MLLVDTDPLARSSLPRMHNGSGDSLGQAIPSGIADRSKVKPEMNSEREWRTLWCVDFARTLYSRV